MSTSGSYDNTTTATEIVKEALSLINVVDEEETLSAEMWSYGLSQLNKLMNFLSVHRGLWLIEDIELTLTPGTESYTIGVGETVDNIKPMMISHARRSETIDVDIDVVSRSEYFAVPNKDLQAPASMIYYHPLVTTGTIYVWPTGTSTDNTLKLTAQRPVQDFDAQGNNPDFPREWVLPIEYTLAEMMAPKYLGGVVPPDIRATAMKLMDSVLVFDEEKTSIRFHP